MTNQPNATGHTKEPWVARHYGGTMYRIETDNGTVADAQWWSWGETDPATSEANAARIVQCVNALAGIPDPAAFVKQAKEAAAAVQAERERCLEVIDRELGTREKIGKEHGTSCLGEVAIGILRQIRQRIESGETP